MNIRYFKTIILCYLAFPFSGKAQCPISFTGQPCIQNALQFKVNSPGVTNHLWDFNGEGMDNKAGTSSFIFKTPGTKLIRYSCRLPDGTACGSSMTIVVKDRPKVRVSPLSDSVQCYENNMFCFADSSLAGDQSGCIKTIKYVFSDGELITKYGSKNDPVEIPSVICKTFSDPQGGNYTLVVEIEDCNGCMIKDTLAFTMKVAFIPALFVTADALTTICKGGADVMFRNKSQIKQNEIVKFRWDFGDGTSDSSSWDSVKHYFSAGTELKKVFNPRLIVYTTLGCSKEFKLDPITVYNIKPFIVADKDSVCFGESISWSLKPEGMRAEIPEEKIRWYFDAGFMMGYNVINNFPKLGPVVVRCVVPHACGPFELLDTVTINGPRAQYEPPYMDPSRRFQCVIKDTIQAVDRSTFYHNDDDFLDDDSLWSEQPGKLIHAFRKDSLSGKLNSLRPYDYDRGNLNVDRTWDFDDNYCQPCLKDKKSNMNTWLNCRFSKDSIDNHWYTPWDSVYRYRYTAKSFSRYTFNDVSKTCSNARIWISDSVYVVRDTVLNYGDNPLGVSSRDSLPFSSITQKRRIPSGLFGKGTLDLPFDLRIYIPQGCKLLLDKRDGSPQSLITGPQFFNGIKNYRIITSPTDSCFFIYGLELHEDLLPSGWVQPWHRVINKIKTPGYMPGDVINPALHRSLFYERIPRCFNMSLSLRDTVHPSRCGHTVTTPLALLPPSARRLSIVDQFCDGYDKKIINFHLSETKPGCNSSVAMFNPDYKSDPGNWLMINNLLYGEVPMGTYEFPSPTYVGYQSRGPNQTDFYHVYNDTVMKSGNPQEIDVGLIIGNGVDADFCADTVYYKKIATFPRLNANIVFAGTNKVTDHVCVDTLIYVTTPDPTRSDVLLADGSAWYLTNANGDTIHMITETYFKVADHAKYPGQKVNYTVIERSSLNNKLLQVYRTDTIVTAIVHTWKTKALPGASYEKLRDAVYALGMDAEEFEDSSLLGIIWNGVGTIGVPATGSKGCIDTAGLGLKLALYHEPVSSTILHPRDTSLLPADSVMLGSGMYKAYAFRPKTKGLYSIYHSVMSYFPSYCPLAKKVDFIAGFYTNVLLSDSIICQGQVIEAFPNFGYYSTHPKSFGNLDTINDYWYKRQDKAGTVNHEGITIWDFSSDDDLTSNPSTIFGGMPYAKKGYRNPSMFLGNEPGGIYYRSPGLFRLRVAASDSNGCVDTIRKNIYVTGPKAGFYTDLVTPECNTIVELFDTSFIIDPCKAKGLPPCDFIYKWTIRWGDGTQVEFLKATPKQIGHDFASNGSYRIWLIIESVLGCRDSVYQDIFIPGPKPEFVPETGIVICVNDSVRFRNRSKEFGSSSKWIWNFGDGFYSPQSDTGSITHQYKSVGRFDVYLTQHDRLDSTGKYCGATYPNPDAGQQKITITVLPYDNVALMANPVVVCVGDTIDITAALSTQNAYLLYNWEFDGKKYVTPNLKLSVAPSRMGKFTVTWAADTVGLHKQFCPDYDTIEVFADSVMADFSIDESQKPVYCFTNLSKHASDYRWGFFHDTDITVRRLEFRTDELQKEPERYICRNFIDRPGVNWVCLEAVNALGCRDTLCKKLVNDYEMAILPPNVFTPGGRDGFIDTDKDGLQGNNVYNIYTMNVDVYHLQIFDRWGVLVFESHDQNFDWNGSINNSGKACPDGTYYYILDYRYKGREKHEPLLNGVIQLIW